MSFTGFPLLERDLAQTVRECTLDVESLQTQLKACDLARCGGMCCHDGVFLGREEQAVIANMSEGNPFEQVGHRVKTRTIPASEAQLGEGFPAHFPKTRCLFLDDKHLCRLQSRALAEGKHPWYWKPFPCWLHPLGFRNGGPMERPILSLPTREQDPATAPGYPGFAPCTTCGAASESGQPAWQVLHRELKFLSELSGRDLLAELAKGAAPRAESSQ